jgi:hypothetical protein
MKLYSFENGNINYNTEVESGGDTITLFDLFQKTVIDNENIKDNLYYVKTEEICRIDNICNNIYNDTSYIEELLVMNNILNPFAIEEGKYLYYTTNSTDFANMHTSDVTSDTSLKSQILSINNNKTSSNALVPSANPGLTQLSTNYDTKTITVINKFK